MAVFRVERNRGYTVMSNHHLRNRDLTLKAKGLLSQMLSLPDNWDYTLAGLSHINREKIDAIREAVRELEKAGYTYVLENSAIAEDYDMNIAKLCFAQAAKFVEHNADDPDPEVKAQVIVSQYLLFRFMNNDTRG